MRLKLALTVFICGAAVMIFELLGSRAAAPYVGSTLYTWTNLIGVILAAMSAGYYWGGRWADNDPQPKHLGHILVLAALSVAIVAFAKDGVMLSISRFPLGLAFKSLLLTLTLFAAPSLFLGMVSPFAARLSVEGLKTSGKTFGSISALSTMGSIVGTFAAGWYLLSSFGVDACYYGLAMVLAGLSFLWLGHKTQGAVAVIILSLLLCTGTAIANHNAEKLGHYKREAQYSQVLVETFRWQNHLTRFFKIGPDQYYSMAYVDAPEILVPPYAHAFDVVRKKVAPSRVMVVGGAGYSYPVYLARSQPQIQVDTVEIDEKMWGLAKEFFCAEEFPNLKNYFADARDFFREEGSTYDMVFYDLFNGFALPAHTATVEAFRDVKKHLTDSGVLVINAVDSRLPEDRQMSQALYATLRKVFRTVEPYHIAYPIKTSITNVGFVVSDRPEPLLGTTPIALNDGAALEPHALADTTGIVLTDDFSPVEHLTRKFCVSIDSTR